MRKTTYLSLVMLVLLGDIGSPARTTLAARERCFAGAPGITSCISGRFLDYWEQNGGLPVFGYPLTPAQMEQTAEGSFLTQYFERQRFELHPALAAPYDVLLGRLGAEGYSRSQGDWRAQPRLAPKAQCMYFEITQRNLCAPFLEYWRSQGLLDSALDEYGQSLALLGLPLTEPRMERNPDGDLVLTQWFERARLEEHGSKGILLGRLGAELHTAPSIVAPPTVQALVAAINVERTSRGLVALTINDQLNAAAQGHSDDMAQNNFFSHIGSDGANAGTRISRRGYVARTWGENIAAGYPAAAEVVAGWMQSDSHRRNILNPDFQEIGVGYSTNPQSTYGTYWVNLYAAR